VAIEQALTVLSWYENLPKADVPPEYLWEDVEGLEQWWASVEEKRSDGLPDYMNKDRDRGDDPDDGAGSSSDSSSGNGMAKNELASYLKDY
jgi:hypothetical protein